MTGLEWTIIIGCVLAAGLNGLYFGTGMLTVRPWMMLLFLIAVFCTMALEILLGTGLITWPNVWIWSPLWVMLFAVTILFSVIIGLARLVFSGS